ncbi:MobF family relaxase, partial [Aureimonas phyllosphaerae]
MISVTRITSIEYYEAQDRAALADRKTNDRQAGRDEVAYYTDNGQSESAGVWWTRSTASPSPASTPSPSPLFPSPFGEDGTAVSGRHLRDLAAGRHPKTKEPLTKGSANGKRSVGFDVQIAAPKSVSAIAAAFEGEDRERLFAGHDRCVRRAMSAAFDMGLVVAHRAVRDPITKKKSYFEEPVREASAAVYRHFTSRAKDPQLHSHAVLMNVGVREDGTTGALDNRRLKLYGGTIAALYRAEMSAMLREEFGIETVRDGRNFEVVGVPEKVLKAFSKRRAEIEAVAREEGF